MTYDEVIEAVARALAKAGRYAYFPGDEYHEDLARAVAPIPSWNTAQG